MRLTTAHIRAALSINFSRMVAMGEEALCSAGFPGDFMMLYLKLFYGFITLFCQDGPTSKF